MPDRHPPSLQQRLQPRLLLPRCAGAAIGEGFGDGFGAFWAGEGLVEVFEDVAAGFAEEGVLVLPFSLSVRGVVWFGHEIDSMGGLEDGSGVQREERPPPTSKTRPPPPQARGRGKLGA